MNVMTAYDVAAHLEQDFIPDKSVAFDLPPELEAGEPPEARGLRRDQVRLMVSHMTTNEIAHTQFCRLPSFLQPGDLLVFNASGTMNAALPARRKNGQKLELHLSTRLPAEMWSVELRLPGERGTSPFYHGDPGERLLLPDGGSVTLHTPHNPAQRLPDNPANGRVRLWLATLSLPLPLADYLSAHGRPIRYGYVKKGWPLSYYQTVFANEVGSAEMPSAGRAFTPELIARLVKKGVQLAPIVLHTGVASLEEHEPPYEEFYRVPSETAVRVNRACQDGHRVIAIGTTVVRALETVTDSQGITHAGEGWTSLLITPRRGVRAVNGILTGLHEPKATHLAMLGAISGYPHLQASYRQALQQRYLWHEFGDMHLIVP